MRPTLLMPLLAACGGGAPAAPPGPPPSVLVVTLDTLRADHLGCYGYVRETSPRLDQLAREGVLFERCLAPMATTLPSHISLFTGVGPIEHGVLANLDGRFVFEREESLAVLAQVFAAAGHDTGAFVSSFVLRPDAGLGEGFQVYDATKHGQRRGDETVDNALAWLAQRAGRPWFLWVHLYDPHSPYDPPTELRGTFMGDGLTGEWLAARGLDADEVMQHDIDLYDAEILFTDRQVGRLLDAVGAEPLVVVTADHGEGLHQHGIAQHGFVWGEQLRVPLLIRAPGLAPRREPALCSLIDLPATLIGLADPGGAAAILAQQRGGDLLAGDFSPRPLLGQSTARKRVEDGRVEICWTTDRWKLLQRGTTRRQVDALELYDLQQDPHERVDVAAERPDVVARLAAALEAELQVQRARRGGRRRQATRSEVEGLEGLGYGGGQDGSDDD